MKRPNVHATHDRARIEAVLFFAQCLDELLFHHTLDSFKAPAMNTVYRAAELSVLASRSRDGEKEQASLSSAIEEIEWSITNDAALSGSEKIFAHHLIADIRQSVGQRERLQTAVDALHLHLRGYWNSLKKALISKLENGRNKEDIHALAAALTAQIELLGFHRRHAYFVTRQRLLSKFEQPVSLQDPLDLAKDFLSEFDAPIRKWRVIYRATKDFLELSPHGSEHDISVRPDAPIVANPSLKVRLFLGASRGFPNYVIVEGIQARDCFVARMEADRKLQQFSAACLFHLHTTILRTSDHCLAVDEETDRNIFVEQALNPMVCDTRLNIGAAKENIGRTTEMLLGAHLDEYSTFMFANALEYHRAALETAMPENQLVDLWAALEGFLPQPKGTSRIDYYLLALLPSIVLVYPERLFRYVSEALFHAGPAVREFVENKVPRGTFLFKTVQLIAAVEYEPVLRELLNHLDDHPLLRYRLYRMWETFKSSKAILHALTNHKRKVGWHIRRIYATRNMIMHSAQSLPYLRTLIENLHSYVDCVIPAVTRLAVESPTTIDVDAAVRLLVHHEDRRMHFLRSGVDERCALANVGDLVFGRDNPLAPRDLA